MTLEEFEATMLFQLCGSCGRQGLEVEHVINNNGKRPRCPHCLSITPLAGVQFLRQSGKKRRQGAKYDTTQVWADTGNACGHCGRTAEECASLHIGLTVQHVPPYVDAGDTGILVPYCARCQEKSTAEIKLTLNCREHADDWLSVVERIREKARHAE